MLSFAVATAGCHLIDDDLSVCGADYLINYAMRLETEVQLSIDEKLSSDVDKPIAAAIKTWSDPFYSGQAHDLDMSFFSLDGTDELLHHQSDIIDANQKSYTLYIPRKDYRHIAVVNILNNDNMTLMGGEYASSMQITQRDADTLNSHSTAIYTARLPMYMADNDSDLTFNVRLYMASAGVAVVLTHDGSTVPTVKDILLAGTATAFHVNDSSYTFSHPSLIRADKLMNRCYAVMAMPSKEKVESGESKVESRERRVKSREQEEPALWSIRLYTTMPDGKITENILTFPYALKAGALEIIKVQLNDDGSVDVVGNNEVGVTVTLDWKEGNTHDVETG